MSSPSGLVVRQFERRSVDLEVRLHVTEPHRAQVMFSTASVASNQVIEGRAVDISSGGMGVEVGQFLPRMCEAMLEVVDRRLSPDDTERRRRVLLEHLVRVRRVQLTGPDPTYELGLAFVDPAPDLAGRIAMLIDVVPTNGPEQECGDHE